MAIQEMGLVWIVVSQMEKAIDFYTKILGFTLNEHHPEYKWAELSSPDGRRLGIAEENPQENVKAGSNAVITLSVADIDESKKDLSAKGLKFIGDIIEVPGHVKLQTFADSDGNTFQLAQKLG